jgi:hypothetical protein
MRAWIVPGAIGATLVLLAGPAPAADMLSNVHGSEASGLVGATCHGTLSDRATPTYHGGVRIVFAAQGGALTAHIWGTLGDEAFKSGGASDFELGDQGEATDVEVKGNQVTFKSVRGALYQLAYGKDGSLNGVNVPTGHTPTDIRMQCGM